MDKKPKSVLEIKPLLEEKNNAKKEKITNRRTVSANVLKKKRFMLIKEELKSKKFEETTPESARNKITTEK